MKQIETWFTNQRRRSLIPEVKDLKAPQLVNLNYEYVRSLGLMDDLHGHSSRINNHLATNRMLPYPPPTLVLKQRDTLQHQAHSELVPTYGPYATVSAYSHNHDLYASELTPPDDPWSAASPVSQSHSSHSSSHFDPHHNSWSAAAPVSQSHSSHSSSHFDLHQTILDAADTSAIGLTFAELPEGQPDLQQCACSAMFEAAHAATGSAMCPTQGVHSFSREFGPSPPSQGTVSPGSCTSSQWEPAFSTCSRTVPYYNSGPGGGTNRRGRGSCSFRQAARPLR